jgi:hypothetical protein
MNGTPTQSKDITETAIEESDGPSSAVKFTNDISSFILYFEINSSSSHVFNHNSINKRDK